MVPDYARGGDPPSGDEIDHMLAFGYVKLHRAAIDIPAFLTPPFAGYRRLLIAMWLPRSAAKYIELHETGHVLAGDADEPTFLQFNGPMPEAEEVADLFALAGVLTREDCEQGPEWVESRIRILVPLENVGWQKYRIRELAPRAIRMRALIDEQLD